MSSRSHLSTTPAWPLAMLLLLLVLWPATALRAQQQTAGAAGAGLGATATTVAEPAPALTPAQSTYLAELQASARQRRLAEDPAWLDLLHIKRHPLTGRQRSLADDAGFFNAPDGATDPAAELDATLAAAFDPRVNRAGGQSAACRFPARLHWLRSALAIDAARLPEPRCERFEQWRASLAVASVSLIFPSAYLNSPASMYGHTFLRLNPGGENAANPMLAYTVSYAADGNEAEGLGFAFKGLTGLYAGIYTTTPYYRRIEEYTHLENRDIWEYDLDLGTAEIDQLLAHTWELGFTRFDYFFFDENCSYQLLALLDVARPGLGLTERFTWWTIPVDTVRALTEVPGLVRQRHYRPANSTTLAWRAAALDDASLDQARAIGLARQAPASFTPRTTPQAAAAGVQHAQALEVAERYASYLGAVDGQGEARVQALRLAILGERSHWPELPPADPPTPAAPETGHGTARVELSGGRMSGPAGSSGGQWRLALRPAYHELLDTDSGYQRGAHIQFGAVEFSGSGGQGARLERFTPVDIVSLTAHDRLLGATSWKARFGLSRTFGRSDAAAPLALDINAGPGRAWELGRWRQALVYALMDNQLWWHAASDRRPTRPAAWSVGSGLHLGALLDPTPAWRLQFDAHWRVLARGGHERSAALAQRLALDANNNLVLRWEWQQREGLVARRDVLLGWQGYW
ncbi:MAG: hypothetical protein RIQ60_1970 [Pseudomonadota bacterium]|jgi:hypothetical protein